LVSIADIYFIDGYCEIVPNYADQGKLKKLRKVLTFLNVSELSYPTLPYVAEEYNTLPYHLI
jgi:hypothetical protein